MKQNKNVILTVLLILLSGALSLAFLILGNHTPISGKAGEIIPAILFFVCFSVPFVLLFHSLFLPKKIYGRLSSLPVAEMQRMLLEKRGLAGQTLQKEGKTLRSLILRALLLALCGAGAAMCAMPFHDVSLRIVGFLMGIVYFAAALSRVRLPEQPAEMDKNEWYLKEEEAPVLYALARKAAKTLSCPYPVRIELDSGCTAGCGLTGRCVSLFLGAELIALLNENELYQVLLHEIAHAHGGSYQTDRIERYHSRMDSAPEAVSEGLRILLYQDLNVRFELSFIYYQFAKSLLREQEADMRMKEHGDAVTAASALIKTNYRSLYDWERDPYCDLFLLENGELIPDFVSRSFRSFCSAIDEKKEMWNALLASEILSRSASHPTLRMRLDALEVPGFPLDTTPPSPEYAEEAARLLARVDSIVEKHYRDSLDEIRGNQKKCEDEVKEWEEAGRPVDPVQYDDILSALRYLGREDDALALAEQAIGTLSKTASLSALYYRGARRLHSYDPGGADDIYAAIAGNSNFYDEGLDMLGAFFCMTGRQAELDTYREKAVVLAQEQKDKYSKTGFLAKGDDLSADTTLSGEEKKGVLDYIASVSEDNVRRVYIVYKKITDDFGTSAVIPEFEKEVNADKMHDILHKIFLYLDTCSDHQYSLFSSDEVKQVGVEKIKGSLVWEKEETT